MLNRKCFFLVVRELKKYFVLQIMRPTQATGNKQLTRLHFLVPSISHLQFAKMGRVTERIGMCQCVSVCMSVGQVCERMRARVEMINRFSVFSMAPNT